MLFADFQQIAADAIARGFAVIPLQPASKDPDFTLVPKVNGEAGTGGACRRTRNMAVIQQWAAASPHANVGVCSDETITILESDNESQFRQLVRDVSRTLFGDSREVPSTLTSQARPGRPHFFFGATQRTNSVDGAPGIQGLFEWRRENQYVVGPGSIHPSGVPYQIINNVPIAPMPDWLVDVLLEIREAYRGESSHASKYVRVGPAAIARDALINNYAMDPHAMLADESFDLHVGVGERHYFLQAMSGLLHDGTRNEEELVEVLKALRDKYCESGKGDYEIENLCGWTIKKPPAVVEPNLPPMIRRGIVYRDQAEFESAQPDLKSYNDFSWKHHRVNGQRCEYVLEPQRKFDGWFPRGRPSLLAGASGAGKSTLMLDLLFKQSKGEYFLGHRGAALRYLVLFADRGRLANEETLERLGLLDKGIPIDHLPTSKFGLFAVEAIKEAIENSDEGDLPQAVFVEGGDMLVSKPNDATFVAEFMVGLQHIAEFYHIAIILSVGAPKRNKDNDGAARRDMVIGSQMWSRNADTVAVLTADGEGTSQYRTLTVQHRNEATEQFELEFKDGRFAEVAKESNANPTDVDPVLGWVESQLIEFRAVDAVKALKDDGIAKSTVTHRLNALIKQGVLATRFDDGKRYLRRVIQ